MLSPDEVAQREGQWCIYTFYLTFLFTLFPVLYFRLKQTNRSLEDFNYSNMEIMEEIYSAMNSTNFLGVSVSPLCSQPLKE